MNTQDLFSPQVKQEIIEFAQALVRIKSYTTQEEEAVRFIENRMLSLGYDEVRIDGFGNVLGRIGSGGKVLFFDSHVDTVEAENATAWQVPPFSGEIRDGYLWGRGSVDMKSAAAASVYAAALAKQAGLIEENTVYVSCSVVEEDCDGECLKYLFTDTGIIPDHVVICEPSNNVITLGHKGKAQIAITTKGVSAHGSAPEKGVNAIYEMAEIIQRVEVAHKAIKPVGGHHGTLVLSEIKSKTASLNAVPYECEIYLDRRMVLGETEDMIKADMDKLIVGKNASWKVGTLFRTTWTGVPIEYNPIHMAWKIDMNAPLT